MTLSLTDPFMLEAIEEDIRDMPKAYGEAFRYIMHRDLRERFLLYGNLARRSIRRDCDPQFIATRFEPAQ